MIAVTMTFETSARAMAFEVSVRLPQAPCSSGSSDVRRRAASDRDVLCEYLLHVAQVRARRQGLLDEAAEDCALEFVERMLLRGDWAALGPAQPREKVPPRHEVSEAWLRRCADNFARNVRRRGRRASRHELPWPERESGEGESHAWEGPATAQTPETELLRGELARQIREAVRRLTPAQQDLFERHFARQESVGEMAAALGRTPHAVSQALLTLRRSLRGFLERQGIDEATARQYLSSERSAFDSRPER